MFLQKHLSPLLLASVSALALPIAAQDDVAWTDVDIMDQVEDELLFDTSVPLNDLDVAVDDGVVSLTGKVETLLASRRAVRLAESVRGVVAVVDEIRVLPQPSRPDWQIENAVEDALLLDAATDSYEVDVVVSDGTAILRGQVDSFEEKDLTLKVVRGVRGVIAIDDQIRVARVGTRPDAEIAADIRGRLRWDALVDHQNIDVAVVDGVVDLTGVVGSAAEKRRVASDAWVAGVSDVDPSGLDVEAWAKDEGLKRDMPAPDPRQVKTALERALMHHSRVYSGNVRVDFDGITATLRGEVGDLAAKRAAANVARHTVGVVDVKNRLRVRPDAVSDTMIAEAVRSRFDVDPIVEPFALEVEVQDGTARLTGEVDDLSEKLRAEDLVARTYGVREIENRIDVVASSAYVYDPYVTATYPYDYEWYHRTNNLMPIDDDWLRQEVTDELFWSPFVGSDDITVSVEDGVVTLSGEVDTALEERMAIENAWQAGATRVRDRVSVTNGSQ